MSAAFQPVAPGYYLEFTAHRFLDRNDRMHLEYESRKHRTEFENSHRIVTFHQHMPTPLADSYYEEFDHEIGGRLPLTEYLKDSLLGILVLHGRTLRAFEPADHVLHRHPPKLSVEILGTAINGQAVATVQAKNGRTFRGPRPIPDR